MLQINLSGKIAFIAGIGDDQGFGWAIAKALAEAGATIIIGTWPPILKIFTTSLKTGKFDTSRRLSNGSLLEFAKIYPLDASFGEPLEVPEEVRENKRYKDCGKYTIAEVAEAIHQDFGTIDIFVHSLANAPEVRNSLLETSKKGYLAAINSSSYSFVSLLSHLGPYINPLGSAISLSYIGAERVIPGYGGGMSSAKAALESDTRTLAWEAGRKWNVRVNTISAGPLGSRAGKAIGFIERMIDYAEANAPLSKKLYASEVGYTAAFLASSLASAITGTILYVDNGLQTMGVAVNSPSFNEEAH